MTKVVDQHEHRAIGGTLSLATGREKLLGHLAMALFASLIAGSFSVGALAVPYIGSAPLNAVRFTIATAVMGACAFAIYGNPMRSTGAPWRYAVLGVLMAVYFVTMFVALKTSHPVSLGAVFTLIPFMSAAFGFMFLRQTSRPIVLISLLIAATGSVWVIFRGNIDAILAFDVGVGEVIFFVGCICHAAYAPLVKRLNRGENLLHFSFWSLFATTVFIALYGAREIAATDFAALPVIVWWAILYLAIFTSAGTLFLVQFASMRLPSSKVFAYTYLTPVIVILIEGVIGHGWVSMSVLAGALVIGAALVVLALAPDA